MEEECGASLSELVPPSASLLLNRKRKNLFNYFLRVEYTSVPAESYGTVITAPFLCESVKCSTFFFIYTTVVDVWRFVLRVRIYYCSP